MKKLSVLFLLTLILSGALFAAPAPDPGVPLFGANAKGGLTLSSPMQIIILLTLLTLLPAAVAAMGITAALLIGRRASTYAERVKAKHPKIATAITTLGDAIADTRTLFHRDGWKSVLGAVTYLSFEILVLWSAFLAVHAHPVPGFAVVVMAYIIGALGGSLPLPASIGTIGGIAGMLIVFGVDHNPAVAAVLLHQAIGLLVPVVGGGIAYMVILRRLGPLRVKPRGEADAYPDVRNTKEKPDARAASGND